MIVILIAIIFLLLGFIFCMWVVSRILGRIGYATHGEKGRKIGRKAPWMLVLVFIAYNIVEYFYVRFQVQYLCKKEAGVFVYVTPEQWKEESKTELRKTTNSISKKNADTQRQVKSVHIDNITYETRSTFEKTTYYWYRKENDPNKFTDTTYQLLVDNKTGNVLIKSTYFSTGVGKYFQGTATSYKFWMNAVPSCSYLGHQFHDQVTNFINL